MEHVHWVKDKNCTIISIICKKIDKIQHPFMTKTLQKLGLERMYLSIIKAIYDKFTADIIWWNLESVSFKIRKKKGVSTLTTSIQQVPEVLARAIGKNKRHPNQRGWFPLLADGIILHIEQHNDLAKKLWELINSIKFPDIKPIYKNQFHVYILTTNYLKMN